jgi:putative ABC transport system substrate-binding protein
MGGPVGQRERVRRRDFIAMLAGSAATWPSGLWAQPSAVPVIGYLGSQSPDRGILTSFQQGLNEFGYFEDRNVKIDYRWALNNYKQLPALAEDLVRQSVALIVTSGGSVAAKAAQEATSTIPILFISGLDPIREHLVESYNRPGGNATGLSHYNIELTSKRLELLNELVLTKPGMVLPPHFACLMNDDETGLEGEQAQIQGVKEVARKLGLAMYYARSDAAIDAAFALMAEQQINALLVGSDPLFIRNRAHIAALAERYSLPAGYRNREFIEAGGLMSYGPSLPDSWRQIGRYAGRILDGAKPQDLPVMFPKKYELVINGRSAAALGLSLRRILPDEIIDSVDTIRGPAAGQASGRPTADVPQGVFR